MGTNELTATRTISKKTKQGKVMSMKEKGKEVNENENENGEGGGMW